jgi:S-adenosylmethionine/arginine decarboxylase-like enzyme
MNARKCNSLAISSPRVIEQFTYDMVKRIDMKAFGRPYIQHFGSGNKSGYTLVQLIETSNITAHFCDETGDAYLDVFSCAWFDPVVARVVVEEWFKPEHVDVLMVNRDAKIRMEKSPLA